jgi:cytochrome b involved in lipid metabolism
MNNAQSGSIPGRRKVPSRGNGSSLVSFQNFLKTNKNPNWNYEHGVSPLTMEEVSKHNTLSDCWTVFRGVVYNIGPFIDYHPGGVEEIMKGAGRDSTELYMKYHPWVNADAVLGRLRLGKISDTEISKKREYSAGQTGSTNTNLVEVKCADLVDAQKGDANSTARKNVNMRASFHSDLCPTPAQFSVHILDSAVGIFRSFNKVRR